MHSEQLHTQPSVANSDGSGSLLSEAQAASIPIILEHQLEETWQQISVRLGVCEHTLIQWRSQPAFRAALTRRSKNALPENKAAVYSALAKKAKSGDTAAMKLYLELTGELDSARQRSKLDSWIAVLGRVGRPPIRQLIALLHATEQAGDLPLESVDAVPLVADAVSASVPEPREGALAI